MQNSSDLLICSAPSTEKATLRTNLCGAVYRFDRYTLSIDHVQGDPFAVSLSHQHTRSP